MPGSRDRVYRAEAIVLRRRNLGEADSVFTFFSPDRGRFEAVARGVRKSRSRMRGHLEPLTRVRILVAHGRSLDVLTQAETAHAYRTLREDLDRLPLGLYCTELVDRFTVENGENPGLYQLLEFTLDALEAGAPPHTLRQFEVLLLGCTGFELQLDACAGCGGRLPEEDVLLSPEAGGFVCRQCRGGAGSGRLVAVRAAKVLRFARTASFEAFAAVRVDDALGRELELVLGDVVRHILEREPSTVRYMDEVERLRPIARAANPQPDTLS
jgi:DNA repair protein RecO (recombination protein O)